MVSLQASTFATATLFSASLAGLVRLCVLRLASTYRSLVLFFACEFLIVSTYETVGVDTLVYAYSFVLLVLLEWFAFGFVLRDLYAAVFARYRGIEILGRWSIYAASTVSCLLALAGAASTGHLMTEKRTLLFGLEFASGCVLVGSVLLIGLILLAISRYPIAMHRNVLVNCRSFASFLLVELGALMAHRVTRAQHTVDINTIEILLSALVLLIWALLLSREGEVTVLKLRRGIDSGEEARLLGQLNAFNTLLLRVARK